MAANPTSVNDLNLDINQNAEETVLRCTGRISSVTSSQLQAAVRELIPQGKPIVLDLTAVSHMDSSGLGAIVGLYVSAKRQACALRLINLNQPLKDLFRITKLASIFEGHQDMLGYTPD